MNPPADPIDILVAHNRRTLALIIGAARHLSKPVLYTHFALGIGTFRDSIVVALTTMGVWADLLNDEPIRRSLTVSDAEGRLLASEIRSVPAMLSMLDAVGDQFESAIAHARPTFGTRRTWTLPNDETAESTVLEGVLHARDLCSYRRARAALALQCAGAPIPRGLTILDWPIRSKTPE